MPEAMTIPRTRQGVRNLDAIQGRVLPVSGLPNPKAAINVGQTERIASAIAGSAIAAFGLSRGSLAGLLTAAVGGALVYRGLTGHCHVYQALGVNTGETNPHEEMVHRVQ